MSSSVGKDDEKPKRRLQTEEKEAGAVEVRRPRGGLCLWSGRGSEPAVMQLSRVFRMMKQFRQRHGNALVLLWRHNQVKFIRGHRRKISLGWLCLFHPGSATPARNAASCRLWPRKPEVNLHGISARGGLHSSRRGSGGNWRNGYDVPRGTRKASDWQDQSGEDRGTKKLGAMKLLGEGNKEHEPYTAVAQTPAQFHVVPRS